MTTLDQALEQNRAALDDMLAAAERCQAHWTEPRAPGKWSPAQVTEHVARALEQSAHVVAGRPALFPTFPAFLRPVARGLFFNRVLRQGGFPKAKTNRAFDPEKGPASPAEARVRLEGALAEFDRACRERADGTVIVSGLFGKVRVADYAEFQAIHTRHHTKQMTSAQA